MSRLLLPKSSSVNDVIQILEQPCNPNISYSSLGPYLQTTWNQGEGYNTFLPSCSSGGSAGHVWAGCVTIAVAQAIRYYNYPTGYNWASMPNASGSSPERSAFIHNVFFSLSPNYSQGCTATGTSIWMGSVPGAIKNSFGFSSAELSSIASSTYIIADNTAGRVTILSGFTGQTTIFDIPIGGGGTGHAWVCDGVRGYFGECYQGSIEYHMNWGWGGSNNGWFAQNSWDPSPGTPADNYQYYQAVVWNIHP
jgi:hypothetical protein